MTAKLLVPVLLCLALTAACGAQDSGVVEGAGFEAGAADAAASRDASYIVHARLRAGSTGGVASELGGKYAKLPIVMGTRGDGGGRVALLLAPDVSADGAKALADDLSREPVVEQVSVERRG